MKILHGADFHVGLTSHGRPVSEFGETLLRFADTAITERVQYAVIAGDLFHNRRPGPEEIRYGVQAVKRMADAGLRVVVVPGNHDGMGTIANPDSHTLAWWADLELPGVHVATGPEIVGYADVTFALLPYAHRRAIESTATLRERTDEASKILEQTIRDLASGRAGNLPLVFVGHLTTVSARLGPEAAMQLGWDTTVDPAVFEGFDVACLGHIHVRQRAGDQGFYAGSPDVHGFDDQPAEEKGWWLHGWTGPRAGWEHWSHRHVPSRPRPFLELHPQGGPPAENVNGAVVRLVFGEAPTPGLIRDEVAMLREAGASFVKVVVPEAERRYRGQSADLGELPIREQMERWLETNGLDKEPALSIAVEVIESFRAE